MAGKKRRRNVPLYVWVSPEELQAIKNRMEQTGIRNMSAYVRKMALNGYVLQALQKDYADLWGPLSELLEKLAQVVAL